MRRFGEKILRVISDCHVETDRPLPHDSEPPDEGEAPRLKEKVDTRKVTFDLFMSGKPLAEIASERRLAQSTIEAHLAHFITKGTIGIDRFLTPDKVSRIREFFLAQENRGLTPAKIHFGEEFSYGELRMVVAHMAYVGAV